MRVWGHRSGHSFDTRLDGRHPRWIHTESTLNPVQPHKACQRPIRLTVDHGHAAGCLPTPLRSTRGASTLGRRRSPWGRQRGCAGLTLVETRTGDLRPWRDMLPMCENVFHEVGAWPESGAVDEIAWAPVLRSARRPAGWRGQQAAAPRAWPGTAGRCWGWWPSAAACHTGCYPPPHRSSPAAAGAEFGY